jgi:hypothetical protein
MKIVVFGKITRLKASPRHGGAGRFFLNFSVIDPQRGALFWGDGVHRNEEYKRNNFSKMIFMVP